MNKKVIAVGLFLMGSLVLGSGVKELAVAGSETSVSTTPDTPKEMGYYEENEEALFEQKQSQKAYKVRYYTLQVQKLEFQENYLQSLYRELERKIEIETDKLNLGYSTEASVQELENQWHATKLQIESVQEEQELCKEAIRIYGGVYEPVTVEGKLPPLSEDYVYKFLEDNLQVIYYDNQIQTYQEYIDSIREDEEYRIQRDLADLDKQQYVADLQVYVKQKMLQYETMLEEIEQVNQEILLIEEKLNTNHVLYEKGKITEIKIVELETEKERLISEKMGLIFDGYCIYYILEEKIEGV